MGVEGMLGGHSGRKSSVRGGRRLTIEAGYHPCVENRKDRLLSDGGAVDSRRQVAGCYSARVQGHRCNSSTGQCYERKDSDRAGLDDSFSAAPGGVSYLSVPETPLRRPSTADAMIEKLHVERHEGGGLSISGVALSAHFHLTLIICGTFCLLAGILLTYVGYGSAHALGKSKDASQPLSTEEMKNFQAELVKLREARTGDLATSQMRSSSKGANEIVPFNKGQMQLKILGPVCIVIGMLMIIIGFSLFALGKKIQRDEKERRRLDSVAQLGQLERSFSIPTGGSPLHTSIPAVNQQDYPILSLRRSSWWIEPNPKELSYPPVAAHTPLPPVSPEQSDSRSLLSSRSSRVSTPRSRLSSARSVISIPVLSATERVDVGSFPELEPPSKMKRVTTYNEEDEEDIEESTDNKIHEQNGEQGKEVPRIDEAASVSLKGSSQMPEAAIVQELVTQQLTKDFPMEPQQRRNSLINQQVQSSQPDINLPYQVPLIQVTPSSNSPSSSLPRLSRHSSPRSSPNNSRPTTAKD